MSPAGNLTSHQFTRLRLGCIIETVSRWRRRKYSVVVKPNIFATVWISHFSAGVRRKLIRADRRARPTPRSSAVFTAGAFSLGRVYRQGNDLGTGQAGVDRRPTLTAIAALENTTPPSCRHRAWWGSEHQWPSRRPILPMGRC